MGFAAGEVHALFEAMAAVLHLGQLTYAPLAHNSDGCELLDEAPAATVEDDLTSSVRMLRGRRRTHRR